MLSKTKVGANKSSVAAGGSIKDNTINIGVAASVLLEHLKDSQRNEGRFQILLEQERDKVTKLSSTLEVTERAVFGFLEILNEQDIPQDQIESKLHEIAERHVDLLSRLKTLSNDAPDIARLREDAAQFIYKGQYGDADRLLAEAESIDQRYIDEQRDALEQRQLSAAETRARRGEISLTRLRYLEAEEHFAMAAKLVPLSEQGKQADYLSRRAKAFHDHGREQGDATTLRQAAHCYTQATKAISRDRDANTWARLQNELGYTYVILGEREGDAARLKEAAAIFNGILQHCDRESVPQLWARTQENLGNALTTLGRVGQDPEHLRQAVAAYRLALKERIRDRNPIDWAKTQNHLGVALYLLGEREKDATLLTEAIGSYQAALEERSRENIPIDWARTKNNLSHALAILGRWTRDIHMLERSLATSREALAELSFDRTPVYWAAALGSMATALAAWGEIESDSQMLEQAIEAYGQSVKTFEESHATFHANAVREKMLETKALLKASRSGSPSKSPSVDGGGVTEVGGNSAATGKT